MARSAKNTDFESVTLRLQASSRGGGIEISLDKYGYKGHRMTAYQNYLGGGLLGRVCNDCTKNDWHLDAKLQTIAVNLAEYFHNLTNPQTEWEGATFEQNQNRPASGY